MYKTISFKKKLLAVSIASLAGFAGSAFAQDTAPVEEVVVLGVKGAQESAVNTKRNAASVVDSISAEDIGKLPDATISDSLQRIPGIQIRRSAGEGGSINVRGMPQVNTQLNGEAYLGANSITTGQPNFGDIPSQLFKGADVIKAPTASLLNSGLTGTINLQTRRPFDFKDGFTGAAAAEISQGADSGKSDPSVNGLINWKNDTVGVLVAGSYSEANLANYYAGPAGNDVANGSGNGLGWQNLNRIVDDKGNPSSNSNGGFFTGNGDGNTASKYLGMEGFNVFNKFTERERTGLSASVQLDLGEGFELISDYFYTKQDEYTREVGMAMENKWASRNYFNATQSRVTGVNNFVTVQEYDATLRRIQSYSQVNEFFSVSQDFSLELKYDNGGPLTASTRLVRGNASQDSLNSYFQADLMDGGPGNTNVWTNPTLGNRVPGSWKNANPNGWTGLARINVDYSGSHPVYSGWDNKVAGPKGANATLGDYIADKSAYNTAAISSENNYDRVGDLGVLRGDASYKFDNSFVTSVDVGYRISDREADNVSWAGTSTFHAGKGTKRETNNVPIFDPITGAPVMVTIDGKVVQKTVAVVSYRENTDGCKARWKATDVTFGGDCAIGEVTNGAWQPFTAIGYVPMSDFKTIKVTDFGAAKGMPDVWAVDPKSMDDVAAFHKKFYGNFEHSVDPGQSYNVRMTDASEYVQANFESGAFSGNLGIRVVETELTVKQNVVGSSRNYGVAAIDNGDKLTTRNYRDVLPALNLALDVTDDVKLRGAYSENMTPLNFNQWGDALSVSYALADGIQAVSSASANGNPNLNPWRSKNMEVSAEWYTAPGSLLSLGIFKVDIDSFPVSGTVDTRLPDLDGVIRRSIPLSTTTQGKSGSLNGVELGAKQSFDFLPGFWSHFGVDANYTYSPSENKALTDITGKHPAFQDNSKTQYNLVLWYQDEALQARLAYNYRSVRTTGNNLSDGNMVLTEMQAATKYLDASVSYDVTEAITVSFNASNITGEKERYYLQFPDQFLYESDYEPRYTVGVRARF